MTETQAFVEISSRSAAELAEKYLALWNEPDADRRRRMIAELWTEDGRHILQPPQEIRGIAARPGLAMTAILEARGYEEIEARAASAYEHWVGSEGLSFRGRDDAERLGDVVKFHWEAVAKDGEVFAVGLNFLVLAADGRIERDYTFVVARGPVHPRRHRRRRGRSPARRSSVSSPTTRSGSASPGLLLAWRPGWNGAVTVATFGLGVAGAKDSRPHRRPPAHPAHARHLRARAVPHRWALKAA